MDRGFAVFADQARGLCVGIARGAGDLGQTPRLARAQDSAVKGADFLDPAQDAGQTNAVILCDPAIPAAFIFLRHRIQPFGHGIGNGLQIGIRTAKIERACDCGLFQNAARIMGREGIKDPAELARAFDHAGKVSACNVFARRKAQHRAVDPHLDQVILQRGLIFQINLGLAAGHFVQRRLRDIEKAAFDHLRHLAEEEGQK